MCRVCIYIRAPGCANFVGALDCSCLSAGEYKDSQEWFMTRDVQDVRVVRTYMGLYRYRSGWVGRIHGQRGMVHDSRLVIVYTGQW